MSNPPGFKPRKCIVEGCTAPWPAYGYQPSKKEPARYACFEHHHLLERPSVEPPALPPSAPAPGDLFGKKR